MSEPEEDAILLVAFVGFVARASASMYQDTLSERVEITTPVNSWKRASEAVYLWDAGLDPYSGIFHEYPISLGIYKTIIFYFNANLVFCIIDTLTAVLLYKSVLRQRDAHADDKIVKERARFVFISYLYSPLTIISCASASTSTFTNFFIAAIFYTVTNQALTGLTSVLLAFLACNNMYFGTLIIPVAFMRRKNTIPIFLIALATLLVTSYFLMGNSWRFLSVVYVFTLKVGDLTPNIGILWYFFTEMFDHFLGFYTWIAQINAFVHVIPLTIYLRESPYFAMYIILLTSTILQPYPSLAYIGLVTSLLPQWGDFTSRMKRRMFIKYSILVCMALWPIFWHLWIIMGTANANFYFGATLAFSTTLIFLMLDLLNAHGCVTAERKHLQKQINNFIKRIDSRRNQRAI